MKSWRSSVPFFKEIEKAKKNKQLISSLHFWQWLRIRDIKKQCDIGSYEYTRYILNDFLNDKWKTMD